ncbi:hypothetical protein [Mycoplasma struthionis]|uniref:hypothetical protein n=1 Tax=Mycoplasma struthionis TaxID=538220 RepID=UPI001FE73359|nr:hypothetical protein [Mycoplasma struthionis]
MKKKFVPTFRMKVILISILIAITFGLFFLILSVKILSPFKVSIYNYESYLEKGIIQELKKDYSYHTFTNLEEFNRAINNKKAVAGVSSDYQIANLILDKKLRKINFNLVYGKEFRNEDEVLNLYPDLVKEKLNEFDNWIINKIKEKNPNNLKTQPYLYLDSNNNVLGFEVDNKPGIDHFYEFLIPYFTLDKLIVYNIDKNNTFNRNNLKENANFDDVKTKENWKDILETLVSKYKKPRVYWTNWYQDNAMIGQFYGVESGKHPEWYQNGEWAKTTKDNYKQIIDSFTDLVQDAVGKSIKNTFSNKLVTDGQELVSSIIEPQPGKSDISIMYNGDALDSYYASDNFESLGDTQHIDFIRPKNNYMNIDAWIVSADTDDKGFEKLLKHLNQYVFKSAAYSEKDLTKIYLKNVYTEIKNQKNIDVKSMLFNDDDFNKPKDVNEIDSDFFKNNYEIFQNSFALEALPYIVNFDAINYTPSYLGVNQFIEKWYFLDEEKNKDLVAIEIFDPSFNKNIKHRSYEPLDLALKTQIVDYYYEKTKS